MIRATSYLRPLGLNEKLYARKTRVEKIEKHAFLHKLSCTTRG